MRFYTVFLNCSDTSFTSSIKVMSWVTLSSPGEDRLSAEAKDQRDVCFAELIHVRETKLCMHTPNHVGQWPESLEKQSSGGSDHLAAVRCCLLLLPD